MGSLLSLWSSLAVTTVPRSPMLLAQTSLRFREPPVAVAEEEDESVGATALMVDEGAVVEGAEKAVMATGTKAAGIETRGMVEAVEAMLAASVVSQDTWPGIAIWAAEEVEVGGMKAAAETAEVASTTVVSRVISPVTILILAEIGDKLGVNVYFHVTPLC